MVSFAEYAFNKSHAAAYAVLAYETGYLKAPLSGGIHGSAVDKRHGRRNSTAKYIRNCHGDGYRGLPPDVNESSKKFSVSDGKIRFGLSGVKNVGDGS